MINVRLPDGNKGILSTSIRRETTYHFPEDIEVKIGFKYLSFTFDPAREQSFEECYPSRYIEFISKVFTDVDSIPCAFNFVWAWELEEVDYEGIQKFGNWWFKNDSDEHWRAR